MLNLFMNEIVVITNHIFKKSASKSRIVIANHRMNTIQCLTWLLILRMKIDRNDSILANSSRETTEKVLQSNRLSIIDKY